MSYSQTYQGYVEYSGYANYNYGPSQSGGSGSAYYSGSVPVDVTIHVDTGPFDNSVDRFNTSIGVLGGSVVAMKIAQCDAINQAADNVSLAIINGFFGTINTELSQQLQALDSAIKAGLGLILNQGKAVTAKKSDMDSDYNRISSRYIKIFENLDDECYKRIITLDRPSFNLSQKVQKQLINDAACNAAAMNLLAVYEIASSKTLIIISSLNKKTLEILQTLHSYIMQESNVKTLINSLLFNEEIAEKIPVYIPVVWCESDTTEDGKTQFDCYISDGIEQQGKMIVTEKVNNFCCNANQVKWIIIDETEKNNLNREFKLQAEEYFSNSLSNSQDERQQRIYDTMMSLWQNAETFSMERSK